MKQKFLVVSLLLIAVTCSSYPLEKPADEVPPQGFLKEPFCASNSICLIGKFEESHLKTADYLEIQKLISKFASYKVGWLNSLEYIMSGVVMFKSYRDDYGSSTVLLVKGENGKWEVVKKKLTII